MVTIEVPVRTIDDEIRKLESLAQVRLSFVKDRILAQIQALQWVRNGGKSPADVLMTEVPVLRLAKKREG